MKIKLSLILSILISIIITIIVLSCVPVNNDDNPPEVISSTPENGVTGYPPAYSITVKFSEPMDIISVSKAFSINPNVVGDLEWFDTDKMFKFFPETSLEEDTSYNVSIGTGAKDKNGNKMQNSYEFSFSTAEPISPVTDGCDTGEIGNYYVAVFNGDDYGWSEDTCDFRSAVYPYDENKSKNTEPDPTVQYTNRLLDLRVSSQIDKQVIDTNEYDTQQSFRDTNPDNYVEGQVYNMGGTNYVLKFKRTHCFVWLKESDDHGNNGNGGDLEDYDDDGDGVSLENYADYFNDFSWDAIINNFTGNTTGWSWGSYPTGVIHIMFEDMGVSPAGYYSPYSSFNAIYINTIPAQNNTDNNYEEPNPVFTNGTLTHEFQHLAHDQAGSPFSTWLNEMCSSAAESVWSGQTGIYINFFNEHNYEFNDVSLIEWSSPDHRHRYAIAALFGTWLSFQSKQGSDNGIFFRTLYQNKNFDYDDLKVVIKTAEDVGIFTGNVDYNDSTSVNQAWRDIYADFVAAMMFNEDSGVLGFNGAWDDPIVNATHPWTGEPIHPEVHYYTPGKVGIVTSGFAFFKVHKMITETHSILVYDPFEVRE